MANKKLGAAGTQLYDKFFSNPVSSAVPENADPEPQEKPEAKEAPVIKKVFSFRAREDAVRRWRIYADARSGMKLDDIGTAAMEEYMKNHPLSEVEKAVFDKKLTEK